MMSKTKFRQPEYFPRGTEVVYQIFKLSAAKSLIVDHVVKNGPSSWVVVSNEEDENNPGIKLSINIHHVTKIIKRGDGGMHFDINKLPNNFYQGYKKNYISIYEFKTYIIYLLSLQYQNTKVIDIDRLYNDFFNAHCSKKKNRNGYVFEIIKKKQVQKWLKRNINRSLLSVKEAYAIEERLNEIMFHDDMKFDHSDLNERYVNRHTLPFTYEGLFKSLEKDYLDVSIKGVLNTKEVNRRLKYNLPIYAVIVKEENLFYLTDHNEFGLKELAEKELQCEVRAFKPDVQEVTSDYIIDDCQIFSSGNCSFIDWLNHKKEQPVDKEIGSYYNVDDYY